VVCFLHLLLVVQAKPIRATRLAVLALVLAAFVGCSAQSERKTTLELEEIELSTLQARQLTLPNNVTSVKFAVIGDSGRGTRPQREVAEEMMRWRMRFPFDFVVMLGDNIYEGPASAEDYRRKFEEPYAEMLAAGLDFFAVLGNHDDPREINYAPFNMHGQRYYSFAPPADLLAKIASRVEFFALDTTRPGVTQLRWLNDRLAKSKAEWKIVLSHHPLYTSGRYSNYSRLYRTVLEPTLLRHGVDAVFSGHEHIYQRMRLQSGVQYFISGGAGSIRPNDGVPSPITARTFNRDLHFMLIEIDRDELHFQAITRGGVTIDAGTLEKEKSEPAMPEGKAALQ
jgi:predicted phosphodiesterase